MLKFTFHPASLVLVLCLSTKPEAATISNDSTRSFLQGSHNIFHGDTLVNYIHDLCRLGSACSHMAALMFKLLACVQLNLNKVACTSLVCEWDKSRKKVDPAPLCEIDFSRPKRNELPKKSKATTEVCKSISFSDPISQIPLDTLNNLHQHCPSAAVFTSLEKDVFNYNTTENSDTDSGSEDGENVIPEPITSLFQPDAINLNGDQLQAECGKMYNIYRSCYSQAHYENLADITATQSECNTWFIHRAGRITASQFHQATHLTTESKCFLNTIMQYDSKDLTNVPAIKHGKENEEKAREQYKVAKKVFHKDFELKKCGLKVNAVYPNLGASPDGLVSCSCHGDGLLEIKCPYKYRNGLSNFNSDPAFPIGSDYNMKTTHPYYSQVQGQMMICNTDYCDFYVWTFGSGVNDQMLVTVERDNPFIYSLLAKLNNVFHAIILPELLTRSHDPTLDNESKLYCDCHRPSFGNMIACDNPSCTKEWFHYSCVGIKRQPRGKWFCKNCHPCY